MLPKKSKEKQPKVSKNGGGSKQIVYIIRNAVSDKRIKKIKIRRTKSGGKCWFGLKVKWENIEEFDKKGTK